MRDRDITLTLENTLKEKWAKQGESKGAGTTLCYEKHSTCTFACRDGRNYEILYNNARMQSKPV